MRWTFFSDTNIWREQLVHRYLQNNICFFRSQISPWRGLSGSRYLELFFSAGPIFSSYQKTASTEAPFNLFWTLTVILTIFASWKIFEKNLVQNLGHYHLKKCKSSCLGGFLKEKQESTFDLFSNFQKPYRPSCTIVHCLA